MADVETAIERGALSFLKSRELLLRAIRYDDMNPDLPPGFNPQQVIFREIEPDPIRPLSCRYRGIDKPTPIDANFPGIEAFALNAAAGHYDPNDTIVPEDNPLSIAVYMDSYIILRLAPEFLDWQFAADQAAVKLGPARGPTNPWSLYGDLKYVRVGEQPSDVPMAGCQLVYFAARHVGGSMPSPYLQKFVFLVDVEEETTVWVDPDVRHPGNSGF